MTTYLTKRDLAQKLQCSVSKIEKAMRQGLPYYKFGSQVRFDAEEVNCWLGTFAVRKLAVTNKTVRKPLAIASTETVS